MKELFVVDVESQVLRSGTWDSPDCDWDWEGDYYSFSVEEEDKARKFFETVELSSDSPMVRLYRWLVNKYGQIEDEELLDERWV